MAQGTVKRFDDAKGFGFITPDERSGRDVFVHYSGIAMQGHRTLTEGQRVAYDVVQGPKGLQAHNVRPL